MAKRELERHSFAFAGEQLIETWVLALIAQAIVGCRFWPSICPAVRGAPQGARCVRSSLHTGARILDGNRVPQLEANDIYECPGVSLWSHVGCSLELSGSGSVRNQASRSERARIANPDARSTLLVSQVKLGVARRRVSCPPGRSPSLCATRDAQGTREGGACGTT